jgi:hypothetical protein
MFKVLGAGPELETKPQFGFAAPWSRRRSRKIYFRLHNTAINNFVAATLVPNLNTISKKIFYHE